MRTCDQCAGAVVEIVGPHRYSEVPLEERGDVVDRDFDAKADLEQMAAEVAEARTEGSAGTFRWQLVDVVDPFGHYARYRYTPSHASVFL